VVFSTKDREPWIDAKWRDRFHSFLGGAARSIDVVPIAVGGVADHVHLLLGLRATHALAAVVRDIKVASSRWAHEETGQKRFEWLLEKCAVPYNPEHLW
jgi:putative transposase